MANNASPAVPVDPVINDAFCAPLAQVDNTAPDTPPAQVVNAGACALSASVKNASLYNPGAPANNEATNAALAPNNNADAPSPVAPTTNKVVMRVRRRPRNPSSWKRNVIASKRLRGKSILGSEEKSIVLQVKVQHLWTYNLGIHDICNGTMDMWSEDVAGRDPNEIHSSVNKYFSNKALDASNVIA
ncbi:hypothetical protein PoB_004915700 [Plakobranchus ocellatus]|uniref:Uncharacterized protein n=1 Tax=Plakobranchus ocellatus TaxID=259542 RepID=A0AAV4BUH2_9GAST|nr:hypothetical protein PoB_004915700 [Plakobranchus ocellatus]